MNKIGHLLLILFVVSQSCSFRENDFKRDLELWYDEPAEEWVEALPVGNGRLGAMVFGGIEMERIQLNEESLWTGGSVERANPEARENLGKVRQLLFEGKYAEGDKLAQEKIMGVRLDKGKHTYQTLGDLFLEFAHSGEMKNYRRSLDLSTATHTTVYNIGDVAYKRELFSSAPDELIVIRISASEKGKISFRTWLERPGEAEQVSVGDRQLLMTGFAEYQGKGTHFASVVSVQADGGELKSVDHSISVENANNVVIYVSGRTDFSGEDEVKSSSKDIKKVQEQSFEELQERHIEEYQRLFNRVELSLNESDTLNIPTDERLERVKSGETDSHLTELFFQFGRYLLISSSRPGNLPANLQGIWDGTLNPPWNADYHININIQMNYWPALITNLGECQYPFFEFIDGLRARGRKTAKEVYGCRGVVAHHTTDIWKYTDPIGKTGYGMWPMGFAWCSDHFWEHYVYTGDLEFLRGKAYPVLKDAALFFVDFLVENPTSGLLVSGPGMSPENKFIDNGQRAAVCMGPAMDHQIIRELFGNCIQSSELLQTDKEFADTLRMMLGQLTPSQIGSDGRVLEWSEELPEVNPGHRHISHLYALYPGEEFTNPDDRKWLVAAEKTINTRLASGGGHTGWSRAWIINFFARLKNGDEAYRNIQALYTKSTLPNLFDNHPPFQIDGNFGATAGIAEMLLQSHNNVLQVLPALPGAWNKGEVKGLRARGGFEVDIKWENSILTELKVKSLLGKECKLSYGDRKKTFMLEAGSSIVLDSKLQEL